MAEPACIISSGNKVRGNLSGAGDLVVEGRVEGHVDLQDHMTVESNGIVVADVASRELTVKGQLSGNVNAGELVSITQTAVVTGDIRAPKVIIEDGARFRGSIDMEVPLPDNL